MQSSKAILVSVLGAIALTACQTTPSSPVIMRADKSYETTGLGETKQKAQTAALNSAKTQCGYKNVVVQSDNTVYNGVVDEKMGRALDTGVKVIGSIFGTPKPNLSSEDDYEYTIKFTCE